MKRALVSRSSGKDSAWTLHVLRQREDVEVVGLLTTINEAFDRVAMHGVRRKLVEEQARAAGLPLWAIPLPWPCPNAEYERIMRATCARAREQSVEAVAFGDLFLEDVRRYRERQLIGTGLEPLFPLWGAPTAELAREMIAGGLRACYLEPVAKPVECRRGNSLCWRAVPAWVSGACGPARATETRC